MPTNVDFSDVTPNVSIDAARNGVQIDVSKRGLRGARGEQGPGVGEGIASITSGRGFWPLRKALAAGTARVVAMGDSKTEGTGVDTVAQRWLNQLQATLRARYAPTGDQGLGYLPAYYATFYGFPSAPTASGSAVEVGNGGGLGNRSRHLASGGSVTWSVPAWTSGVPLLVHWTQHPGLGSLQVVTGGTVRATIDTGGATIESKVTSVTIPAGTTSITVRQSGTGTGNAARVEGIVHRTATSGVIVYDAGRSGARLDVYAAGMGSNGAPQSDDWHWQAVAAVQPHAVLLAFGANDQASRTVAQWGADLKTVVAKAKAAAPGAGIVVLHGAQRTEDVTADPTRVLKFEAAARAAVGADPDVTILYESSLWAPTPGVDYTQADPSGWLADTVHVSPAGNAQIARYLAAQITGADAATDALEVAGKAIQPAVTAAQAARDEAAQSAEDVQTALQAQFMTQDEGVAALIGTAAGPETKAAGDARWQHGVSVLSFGAKGDGTTDDRAAIQAAIDSIGSEGGRVFLPPGTYRCVGNINGRSFLTLTGSGYSSRLRFEGGGLIFQQATKFAIDDMRISRTGAAGACISILPGATNGCSRWSTSNVNITASTGSGWHMEDTWIVSMFNPIIQGCQVGMKVAVGPLFSSSANGVTIHGGEWQANVKAGEISGIKGWAMNGLAVEGNTAYGLDFTGTCRDVKMDAVYFEGNPGYDISWNCNPSGGYGFSLDACGFLGTAQSGPRAILITRGQGINIANSSFVGYTLNPILLNESPALGTSGVVRNCTLMQGTATRVLEVTNSANFGDVVSTTHNGSVTAAVDVRTEFPRFTVRVPLESANTVRLTGTFQPAVAGGIVYFGIIVYASDGTTVVQTLANQVSAANTSLKKTTLTLDVSGYRGQDLIVGFRRYGENALDTNAGAITYYEGLAEVRHGVR